MSSTPTQDELFSSLPVPVALRRMILPAAISQIIVLIYNMADTFYIGRTDNPYMLAGASLILPVFNMLLCLASLAGIGGGTLISRLLGAGQPQEARKVSAFSFYLAILLSLAFSVGLGVFMDPALRFLAGTARGGGSPARPGVAPKERAGFLCLLPIAPGGFFLYDKGKCWRQRAARTPAGLCRSFFFHKRRTV